MNPNYISTFIFGAGVILGVFQALVLFGIPKGNRHANRILAFLLLAFSVNIAHSLLFSDIFYPDSSHYIEINEPFQFLLGPLVFLYVRELISETKQLKRKDLFHFLPFALYSLLTILMTVFPDQRLIYNHLKNKSFYITVGIWCIILLHVTIYTLCASHLVKLHSIRIKNCYSDIDRINLRWLKYFIHVLHIIYIVYIFLLVWLLHRSDFGNPFPHFQMIISCALLLILFFLGYKGMVQPNLFSYGHPALNQNGNTIPPPKEVEIPVISMSKYGRSGLDEPKSDEIAKKLKEFMESEKPYLNPELTLPELSELLDIPRNIISQVLNDNIGVNFYDFINGYRIKEVQVMIADPQKQHLKLLALAFDAGFNSKATFNNTFKKSTGMTPSEYRKSIEN